MTAPIHVVSLLRVGKLEEAVAELNRSAFAACYGPFNVRNEVDVHSNIVGGHFNNSHFLTGDGGYLQALFNGFAGVIIDSQGLILRKPYLVPGTESITLVAIHFRGFRITYKVSKGLINISYAQQPASQRLCVKDVEGSFQKELPVELAVSEFSFPGLIFDCSG
eukprot:m.61669 g.61669  ORF g.61669 m.61669 type:complete len:164 (+) comp19291_c0_seq2:2075-2566(+)